MCLGGEVKGRDGGRGNIKGGDLQQLQTVSDGIDLQLIELLIYCRLQLLIHDVVKW